MAHINAVIRWLSSWQRPFDLKKYLIIPEQDAGNLVSMCKGIIEKSAQRLQIEPHLLMNNHQCAFLVKRLSKVKKILTQLLNPDVDVGKTTLTLQELHQVLEDADRLLQSSCISTSDLQSWVRAAIEQNDMKEPFSRILYELRWHTDVLQSILVDIALEPTSCNGKLAVEEEALLWTAFKKDEMALKDRLTSAREKLYDSTQKALASQLLQKMNATVSTSDSIAGRLLSLSPQNPTNFYCGVLLGKGASASVHETNLLGGEYAVKIFECAQKHYFQQEVEALQRLGNHPNIVRLFCHTMNESNSDCFLIMEKMDMELSKFLKRRMTSDDDGHRKLLEAVVLMLQIAEGIRYIHSKQLAHRDLKPGNVLVTVEDPSSPFLSRARSVKIADFGLTKTRNTSRTYTDQTMNTGTTKYMAPEVINEVAGKPSRAALNPRRADSYSFAIMCSEILTGEDPFSDFKDLSPNELKKRVKANSRPKLPPDCPLRLRSLIDKCWAENFHTRPVFPEICQELRYIKGLLLRGDSEQKLKTEFASNMVEHQGSHDKEHSIIGDDKLGEQVSDIPASIAPKGVRQGPWGREEPHKKKGLFDHVADSIKWMRLKYQQSPPGVGFLEVGYVSGDTEFTQAYCDNIIGTTWRTIHFASDEYIKQISGSVAPHEVTVSDSRGKVGLICVVSLTIHTNRKSYGPFGDESVGKRFRSGTGKVFGFFGAGSVLLDKLGVWIIPDGEDDGDQSFVIEQ